MTSSNRYLPRSPWPLPGKVCAPPFRFFFNLSVRTEFPSTLSGTPPWMKTLFSRPRGSFLPPPPPPPVSPQEILPSIRPQRSNKKESLPTQMLQPSPFPFPHEPPPQEKTATSLPNGQCFPFDSSPLVPLQAIWRSLFFFPTRIPEIFGLCIPSVKHRRSPVETSSTGLKILFAYQKCRGFLPCPFRAP